MNRCNLIIKQSWLLSFAFTILLSCPATGFAEKVYTLGVVPQFDARRLQSIWQPILMEIEKQTGVRLELIGSPNITKFEEQFMAGDFDLAYMNPYHLLKAHKSQGYKPMVRDVGRNLYGIIVTRKDSSIQKIEDLEGKTVAFPAPNALGAALIPRTEFSEKYKINIQTKYVRSHSSVYLNVVMGMATAGGGVQKTLNKQPENIQDTLKVIYKTPEVASHPLAVHARVPKLIQQKLLRAFIQLGNTPEGRKLLAMIPMKKIGIAALSDYEPLKKMGLDKYYVK